MHGTRKQDSARASEPARGSDRFASSVAHVRPLWHVLVASAALVVAVAALYAQVRTHSFVAFDTHQYILSNPHVLNGFTWDGVRWAFTAAHAGNWHPLTWISLMLDVSMFGVDPRGFHVENVVWHAANTVVLFVVFLRLTGAFLESWIVAALFALHPLHVESVAWVVERKDLLSAFFGFAALGLYGAWVRTRGWKWYAAALVAFACGLMSKPMLVTWPFVLLLLDVWPLARRETSLWTRVIEKLPWFAVAIASMLLTVWAQSAGGAIKALDYAPFETRIANAVVSYWTYVRKTFWPVDLCAYYPHALGGIAASSIILALVALGLISVLAFACRKRAGEVTVGWLFFLGTLVPVIGIVQVGEQALADRYTYIPTIGITVMVAFGLRTLCSRSNTGLWVARGLQLACLVPLSVLTARQVATWKNTRTMCENAFATGHPSYTVHDMMAITLTDEGRVAEAMEHYRAALSLAPIDGFALENLGVLHAKRGEQAEAAELFERILSIQQDHPSALKRLGMLRQVQNRLPEALALLQRSASRDPNDAETFHNLGGVLERLNRRAEAEAAYRRAADLNPSWTLPLKLLANLELGDGKLDAAYQTAARVLEREPASAEARRIQARVVLARGDARGAAAILTSIVREFPDWPGGLADLAWIRAVSSDPSLVDVRQALELANRAVAKSGEGSASALDSLAAAQAANGKFDAAVQTASRAVAAARTAADLELASRIERRLQAYRQGRLDRDLPR